MSSVAWDLQIAQYLKLANPDATTGGILSAIGAGCQGAVERAIGRTFDTKSYSETYDGNDRRILFLRHDPVVSLTTVSIYGSPSLSTTLPTVPTYAPAVAMIEPTGQGVLLTDGTVFSAGIQNVRVVYNAGLSDLETDQPPADLVFAVTYWAAMLFRDRDRLGLASETVGAQVTAYTRTLPLGVAAMCAAWRRPVIPC
jgi:hypothetical protein